MIPKNVPSHRPIRKMPIAGDRTRRRWRYRGAEMTGGGTFPNEALGDSPGRNAQPRNSIRCGSDRRFSIAMSVSSFLGQHIRVLALSRLDDLAPDLGELSR